MTAVLERLRVVIDGDNSGALRAIKGTESAVGKSAGGIGKSVAGIGVALGGAAAVAGVGLLAKAGLDTAAANEQAAISFETMLGSAEKAQSFLKQMKDFAATTPFELPELQTAAGSLISIGIGADKVIPIMKTLGDVTSGMGTGAEGVRRATVAIQQMNAAGRITAEDLNQLRDAGIPVFDLLAGATGKTKEELAAMAQNGKLGRQELTQLMTALETGKGLERFNGLMEKQSQSLTGLLSTLKDTVGQQLAEAMGPAVEVIKAQLPGITQAVGGLLGALGPAMGPVFEGIGKAVQALLPAITPIVEILGKTFGSVLGKVATLVERVVAPVLTDLTPVLETVAEVVLMLADAVGPVLAPVLQIAASLLKALAPLLKPLATLVVAVAGALGQVLGRVLTALEPVLATLSDALLELIMALLPPLLSLLDALVPILNLVADLLAAGLAEALALVIPLVQLLAETLAVLIQWIADVFAGDWGKVWENFVRVVDRAIGWVIGFFSNLPGVISRLAANVWKPLANAFIDVINFIIGAWNALDFDFPGFDGFEVGGVTVVPGWDAFTLGVPDIPKLRRFHQGGLVPGPPGAEMVALLTAGERVLSPAQTRAYDNGATSVSITSPLSVTVTGSVYADDLEERMRRALADRDRDLVSELIARGLVPRR